MDGYRVVIAKGGHTVFKCDKCEFSVELKKFGLLRETGAARTLGAEEMNAHIRDKHPEPRQSRY